MKRTIGFIISILIVLAIVGIVVFNIKQKPVPPQDNQQYGLLKPKPGETLNIRDFNGNQNSEQNAQNTPNTPQQQQASAPAAPKGKVLGTETEAPAAKPTPKPVPKPAASTSVSENTLATYNITALSFVVSVPQNLHPVSTTKIGNVIQFFDAANKEYGEVEVLPNAFESLSALTQTLQADPNVSGLATTTAAGQSALIFNDARYGRIIAFVYKDSVYYLRGAFAASALANFRLE